MRRIFVWIKSSTIQTCASIIGMAILLIACTSQETPSAFLEFTSTPTQISTPTATIDWFPATATPTIIPTSQATPTPEFRTNVGEVLFSDNFSEPGSWTLGQTSGGNVNLGINELTIAIAEPESYAFSIRQEPILDNFYLEVTTSTTLCRDEDQYGILLRMSSPADFYRYAISCDGRVRLDRIVQGSATSPQPWINSGSIPPGAPITSRLGVWMRGNEMHFFINDQHQFSVSDPLLQSGNLGLFARSMGENAVTVNFSNLVVRKIEE